MVLASTEGSSTAGAAVQALHGDAPVTGTAAARMWSPHLAQPAPRDEPTMKKSVVWLWRSMSKQQGMPRQMHGAKDLLGLRTTTRVDRLDSRWPEAPAEVSTLC
jgi:hypothetical protein